MAATRASGCCFSTTRNLHCHLACQSYPIYEFLLNPSHTTFLACPRPRRPPRMRSLFALPATLLSLVLATLAQNEGSPLDYAPHVNQSCPDVTTAPLIRVFTPQNQTLHPDESQYIDSRLKDVIPQAWADWIGNGSQIGYNQSTIDLFKNNSAKIGISISGGGYRAAQYGAGVLSGLDARNDSAKQAGTGGLLQVSSYIAGLSGALPSCFARHMP